jgi:hypothetical protein
MPVQPNPSESGVSAGSKLIIGISFLAACFLLLPFYRYELTPDSITYLAIAKQYASGYFGEAVSGYWAPLFSWLIAPVLVLHVPEILAAKIICVAAAVFALISLHTLAGLYPMSTACRAGMLISGAIVIASYAFEFTGPDLLFAALLLCYFRFIFDFRFPSQRRSGVYCGLLGGLAYLTKGYGLFFFGAHFALFCALHWLRNKGREERAQLAKQFLSGLAVFFLIVLAWLIPLRAKYGFWNTGSTGAFNFRLVGPESSGYPHLRGLEAPPSPHATNAWQEPPVDRLKNWSIFANAFTRRHEGKLIAKDTKEAVYYWLHAAPLFVFLLLACLLFVKTKRDRWEWLSPLLTIVLFTSGYLLITVEQRYLWLTALLLLWMTFYGLDRCLRDQLIRYNVGYRVGYKELAILCIVGLSFAVEPLRHLHAHFRLNRALYETSTQLHQAIPPGSRLASCNNWADSAYLAYELDARYFGTPLPTPDADENARALNPDYSGRSEPPNWDTLNGKLEAAGIQYFLAWPGCTQPPKGSEPQLLRVPLRREQVQK